MITPATLWQRRFVRVICWLFITLLILLLLGYALASWTGGRRWQRIKHTLDLEKETLDFRAILPPPVPEARNFAAIEPLRGINLAGDTGPHAAKRQALSSLRPGRASLPFANGIADGEKTDLRQVYRALRASKDLEDGVDLPKESSNPALTIRETLERTRPLLKTLAEAARARPQAEFSPSLHDRSLPAMLFSLPMPHYGCLSDAAAGLRLHGHVCLESGDASAAVADALAILRLAEAAAREPLLVGFVVSTSLQQQALELVWAALGTHQVSEADLHTLQDTLQRLDHEAALLAAMRGELIAATSTIDFLVRNDEADPLATLGVNSAESAPWRRFAAFAMPKGFFLHNQAAIAEEEWHHIIRPLKQYGIRGLLAPPAESQTPKGASIWRPDRWFVSMVHPSVSTFTKVAAYAESVRRQALIACALESHRLRHAAYPETLQKLVQTAPALDLIDGRPMRYRLTPQGGFLLWSIGIDGKDDGGIVPLPPAEKSRRSLRDASYRGDWPWRSGAAN